MEAQDDLFDMPGKGRPRVDAGRVALRAVEDGDRFLIRRWLALPHVAAWFGSRSAAEASVALAAGQESALQRLILLDGTPVGYLHALDADQYGAVTLSRTRHDAIPAGAWLAEIFIAEEALRGRGVGGHALALMRDEVFATTLAPAVILVAGIRHERQVRAIERAGFHWTAVVRDSGLGAAWLMIAQRPSNL